MILDGKKISYSKVDVSADEAGKAKMRELAGDSKALPPQLANGDSYCGVSRHGLECGARSLIYNQAIPIVARSVIRPSQL